MSSDTPEGTRQSERLAPLRILLADDHQIVRRGLQLKLDAESDLQVVAQVGDNKSVARKVTELQGSCSRRPPTPS